MGLEVRVLGPLEVAVDGRDVTPSAPKERALLAVLIAQHPRAVSVDALTEELWPALPRIDALRVLRVRIAGLRKAMRCAGAPDLIEYVATGYRLSMLARQVDSNRFFELVERGREELQVGDPANASSLLRDALGLWRGEPYEGVRTRGRLDAAVAHLSDAYVGVVEDRVEADLACGRHRHLAYELEGLVAKYPLRERLWEHRVVALYRCGRQADALRACAEIRNALRDELGLLPGARLRALESAVLEQRVELDWVPASATPQLDARDHAPPVRYARSGAGVHVAYQVSGHGPDLIIVPGFTSHLEVWWAPWSGRVAERLSSSCRLIVFDKRGTGLSDRPTDVGIEGWLEDIGIVLDAVGSQHATVLGMSAGGPVATMFAARHPQRVRSLVLWGTTAKYLRSDDYPLGMSAERIERILRSLEANWGQGVLFDELCPSAAGDPVLRKEFEHFERISASPGAAVTYLRALLRMDVRDALPLVEAPTLVIHAARDRTDPVERARYMADRIPDATMIELDSEDHLIWLSDVREQLLDEVEAFVRRTAPGTPRPPRPAVRRSRVAVSSP